MNRMERHNTRVRSEMLDAWGEVLAEQGYAASTVGDVATRAGMARSSVYRYFPDKESLFFAYVEDRVLAFVEAMREQVSPADDAPDRLRQLVIGELHGFAKAPGISLTDVPETLSREGRERLLVCFLPLRELARDILEQGHREGSLGVLAVDEAIDVVFACIEVFRVRMAQQWVSPDQIADDVADFVLRGLGAATPRSAASKPARTTAPRRTSGGSADPPGDGSRSSGLRHGSSRGSPGR